MIASISIYIKSTFHVIRYKNEMKFHMLMFMNACALEMQTISYLGHYRSAFELAKADSVREDND